MKDTNWWLCWLVLGVMFAAPGICQEGPEPGPLPKHFAAARVVDHQRELAVELSPFLTIVFRPDTFTEDTAVTARLDLDRGELTITSRGGAMNPTPAEIHLTLSELTEGLRIVHEHRLDSGARIDGVLTDNIEDPLPQFVIVAAAGLEPVVVDDTTMVLLSEDNRGMERINWKDLAYGDHVQVRYGRGRRASLIEASRVTGQAVVDRVSGDRLMLVGEAVSLIVNPRARLEDADGGKLELASLRLNDQIFYRQNPQTREVWHVTRIVAASDAQPLLAVTHDSEGPLLPGDRVRITANGSPGGTVTFDIIGVESDLEATELVGSPGTYQLFFTIPRGISVDDTQIVARLDLSNGHSHTVLAEKPLIFTAAGAAAASQEASAKQAKPSSPVIISPVKGEKIGDTIVVSGTASPNQKIRIVIDFVITKSIITLGEGRLIETEVFSDTQGVFKSEEIQAEVRALISGDTDYTITVTAVAGDGSESDPAVLRVRRPD